MNRKVESLLNSSIRRLFSVVIGEPIFSGDQLEEESYQVHPEFEWMKGSFRDSLKRRFQVNETNDRFTPFNDTQS
jgi:hypothetical protein